MNNLSPFRIIIYSLTLIIGPLITPAPQISDDQQTNGHRVFLPLVGHLDPCDDRLAASANPLGAHCPRAGSSSGSARGDFNGDRVADLVVSVPNESLGTITNAGAVNIIYGSASGLTATGNQFLTQATIGTQDRSEARDHFGSALAAGNFNGDEYSDLAIGVAGEDVQIVTGAVLQDAGIVQVLYGSPSGLTNIGSQIWHQDSPGVADAAEPYDEFGSSLTWADFNRDGYGDLVIGAPDEDVGGISNAGAVNVLYGSASGLTPTGNQLWTQDSADVAGMAESGDAFGFSLATGDFNRDSFADLAVGVPAEGPSGFAPQQAGAVNVLYGSGSGLTTTGNQVWSQDSADIEGAAEDADRFGFALAAGDFNGDSIHDLAIGVPDEDVGNVINAGGVNIIYGSARGLSAFGNQFWSQDSPGLVGTAEEQDFFGEALAAGDFNGDTVSDLAVGSPGEDIAPILDAGQVNVIYGSQSGLAAAGSQRWLQEAGGIAGTLENGDRFGSALTAWNFGRGRAADLAIGVPLEDVGTIRDAGVVNVIYGSSGGLSATGNQIWGQDAPDILDSAESGDHFGSPVY